MIAIFITTLLFLTGASGSLSMDHTIRNTELKHEQFTAPAADTGTWSQSLSKFRNALLTGDKETVKSFFKFPVLNPGNDIWLVADMSFAAKMDLKKPVPFKESHFDQYYSALFSVDFRKTLEAIDPKKLSGQKTAESPELKMAGTAVNKMVARYSEAKKTLTLSLITKSPEFGKYVIDYHFTTLASGDIRFSHVKFIL